MRDFVNIKIEMTRAGINVSDVANEMGITPQALYHKLNGKTEFTLSQMQSLRSILVKHLGLKPNENLSLEYLFGGNYGD